MSASMSKICRRLSSTMPTTWIESWHSETKTVSNYCWCLFRFCAKLLIVHCLTINPCVLFFHLTPLWTNILNTLWVIITGVFSFLMPNFFWLLLFYFQYYYSFVYFYYTFYCFVTFLYIVYNVIINVLGVLLCIKYDIHYISFHLTPLWPNIFTDSFWWWNVYSFNWPDYVNNDCI